MRNVCTHYSLKPLSPQFFSALRFCDPSEPLFLRLRVVELNNIPGDSIPLIPSVISPRTTSIDITFFERSLHLPTAASAIATLPALCPNLERICLPRLPSDPVITTAVSELAISTNQNTLRHFDVGSPLTELAREVIYKHPELRALRTVVDTSTALPTMVLPNLLNMEIEYHGSHNWIQGFHKASLGKLVSVIIFAESESIGDFLGAFKAVALTTSIPTMLSNFEFLTKCSWRPSYHSLLPFTQMRRLIIQSPCKLGDCSSTIGDDTITALARAMPNLETLNFDDDPCDASVGVTVKGLATLAYYCPSLLHLVIHFQVASLDPRDIPSFPSADESTIPRRRPPLPILEAGYICVPRRSAVFVAVTLLLIFPSIQKIHFFENATGWDRVMEIIDHARMK